MQEQPNDRYIKELSNGDPKFRNELIEVLKRELPEEISTYNCYLKKNQFSDAAEVVHKIKHKISIFGLFEGYVLAERFEDELKADNVKLSNEFSELLNSMMVFLNKI